MRESDPGKRRSDRGWAGARAAVLAPAAAMLVLSACAQAAELAPDPRPIVNRQGARLALEDDRAQEIPALADRHTLHALAARDSAKGRAALALIDRGLATLRDTGEWFEVIARHRSDPLPGN